MKRLLDWDIWWNMKTVKLNKGACKEISLKDDGVEYISESQEVFPYVQIEDKIKKYYALCPYCDQPVRINGLHKENTQREVYASHAGKSIPGLGETNVGKMQDCDRFLGGLVDRTSENKYSVHDESVQEMLKFIHDNYDKILFIMEKETGLHFSSKQARVILETYVNNQYWNHKYARYNNIPWILLEGMGTIAITDCIVKKDSEIYSFLEDSKDYKLVESKTIKNYYFVNINHNKKRGKKSTTSYILHFFNLHYSQSKECEILPMRIEKVKKAGEAFSTKEHVKKSIPLELNVNDFVFYCTEYKGWNPNEARLTIANEVLGKFI